MSKTRSIYVDGSSPGVLVVDIDPPLMSGEVEINVDDIESALESMMTVAERAALCDLLSVSRTMVS